MFPIREIKLKINGYILFFKEYRDGTIDFNIRNEIMKESVIEYKGTDKSNFFKYFARSIIATNKVRSSD